MDRHKAYGLSLAACTVGFIAWGQGISWHFSGLSTYRIFPLFGLLAFSLMWSIYMVNFIRRISGSNPELGNYYNVIGAGVLAAILLHPGLLWWQLWRDGFGLPPNSYLQHYVAPSLKWAALIGTTAWLIFLIYEFRYKFRDKSWWKYIEYLADAALLGIFIHALKLGHQTRSGWFMYVWYFYGITLVIALSDLYYRKLTPKRS